ncbi:polysaccharide deacetylase family protein [Thermodesulfobacteriota bacterium]
MNVKLYITIDTEEDNWDGYAPTDNPVNNILALPKLQRLFDQFGAVPTYLVSYPVVTNDVSFDVLKEIMSSGRCELGAHCHPWNTPPFLEKISVSNSMLCNLSADLIEKKISILHQEIVNRFGVTPKSFRSGRWAFNGKVAQALINNGYKIDTSITPFTNWGKYAGPDFSRASAEAYSFDSSNIFTARDDGLLLEIPPTVGFLQKHQKTCAGIRNWIIDNGIDRYRLLGVLDKFKMVNYRWLSPELNDGPGMISLAKSFIRNGHRFLNMSFHSTTLLPGCTPFVKSEDDLQNFLHDIEIFLEFCANQELEFQPLHAALG